MVSLSMEAVVGEGGRGQSTGAGEEKQSKRGETPYFRRRRTNIRTTVLVCPVLSKAPRGGRDVAQMG